MTLLNGIASNVLFMGVFAGIAWAQDRLVPAGTLLKCILDEPKLSSATADHNYRTMNGLRNELCRRTAEATPKTKPPLYSIPKLQACLRFPSPAP